MDDQNQQISDSQSNPQQATDDQNNGSTLVTPVSVPQKEFEAIPSPLNNQEVVKPTELEPKLNQEVKEAGVEVVSEKPVLDHKHGEIGVIHSHESITVQTEPSGIVQLPMTAQQAQNIIKTHKGIADSIVWLAVLVLRQIKIMRNKVINKSEL